MLTRRQILAGTLCAPVLGASKDTAQLEVMAEETLLSQESAAGFKQASGFELRRRLIVAAAVRNPSQRTLDYLRRELLGGAVVVLESGFGYCAGAEVSRETARLNRQFSLALPGRCTGPQQRYVDYRWPHSAMIRSFGPAMRVNCEPGEVVATSGDEAVAFRRAQGRGELIFLGSMLGPALFAGDREAHGIWRSLYESPSTRSSSLSRSVQISATAIGRRSLI